MKSTVGKSTVIKSMCVLRYSAQVCTHSELPFRATHTASTMERDDEWHKGFQAWSRQTEKEAYRRSLAEAVNASRVNFAWYRLVVGLITRADDRPMYSLWMPIVYKQ